MKFSFNKYPIDLITCLTLSIILLPIVLLDIQGPIRTILGLPYILFIPGYVLIFALFPTKKTTKGIDKIERIALSFGMSITTSLIGLGLNYTPWGITQNSTMISIFLFIIILGIIGYYRWLKTKTEKRFIIKLNIKLPKGENKTDQALTYILIITIIIALTLLVYVIVTPKTGEKFTEFYILGAEGIADQYPRNLSTGENATVIIGIVNHEYKTINYTTEIWLINQSTTNNETIIHNMWFLDKINIKLKHRDVNIEEKWKPQWEQQYNFSITKKGNFKLAFLLYNKNTEEYNKYQDYQNISEEKIKKAYRSLHLWLNIK